jgi:hypothetical protein
MTGVHDVCTPGEREHATALIEGTLDKVQILRQGRVGKGCAAAAAAAAARSRS